MSERPGRRVLVTNCVLANTGDAAITLAIVELVRERLGPNVQLTLGETQPEVAARLYPDLTVVPLVHRAAVGKAPSRRGIGRFVRVGRRWRLLFGTWMAARVSRWVGRLVLGPRALRAIQPTLDADMVISTGGTYLVPHYETSGRLLEMELALAAKRPLMLFTQSMGPFAGHRDRRRIRRVVQAADAVLLRDERSRDALLAIDAGVSRVSVTSDAAFGLPPPPRTKHAQGLRVAFSVRHWPYVKGSASSKEASNAQYQAAIAAAIALAVGDMNASVTLVSSCQGVPEYWTDDSAIAAQIANTLPASIAKHVDVDRLFRRPAELMEHLETFDAAVCTRMHVGILALVAGTPVLPIAYEFKSRELFRALGLGEWVSDFEDIDAEHFPAHLAGFLSALPELRLDLAPRVAVARLQALQAGEAVAQAAGSSATRR